MTDSAYAWSVMARVMDDPRIAGITTWSNTGYDTDARVFKLIAAAGKCFDEGLADDLESKHPIRVLRTTPEQTRENPLGSRAHTAYVTAGVDYR
jgi:hypothetical protein